MDTTTMQNIFNKENWICKDAHLRSPMHEPEWKILDDSDFEVLENALAGITKEIISADEEAALARLNFSYMLLDGKKELAFNGDWKDHKKQVQQYESDNGWEDYSDPNQELINFFDECTSVKTFFLRTCAKVHFPLRFVTHGVLLNNHYMVYAIDLERKTQTNMITGRMRKIREKQDPLLSFSTKCQAHPITADMLGDEAETFTCPILQDVPLVPVIASDGHLYDYGAIKDWMKRSDESPMTKETLTSVFKPAFRDRTLMESAAKRQRTV